MDDFIKSCKKAPRINAMANFFSNTASGENNRPYKDVEPDTRLFCNKEIEHFSQQLINNSGSFVKHYFASIPYSLEEECRLGNAIINFARKNSKKINVYCLGMAEGAMARTISQESGEMITTLTTSPTAANELSFYKNHTPKNAYFICTPFFMVDKKLTEDKKYTVFNDGFDIIIEDTTFQMYSPDRDAQIKFTIKLLKKDGLFIFTEKFKCDEDEYNAREIQKDMSFKRRFFTETQLDSKRNDVLRVMSTNEVTIEEMKETLDKYFKYKAIYWNSGNFYSIVASSSESKIKQFLSLFSTPCIPSEYVYCDLPKYL
ncbi:hypothetical protein H4F46_18235 [Pectobacterium brasiliense]|uniref:hypothetical protein n=1 Tax=Pectobacterium brasiliense TaxID=180957 RepID=UPI001968FD52|nr:hypothetical protein [Pectobacterium brasiliense]MBN3116827.1 hypothetical protein [Pectobacterium brasiliense]